MTRSREELKALLAKIERSNEPSQKERGDVVRQLLADKDAEEPDPE